MSFAKYDASVSSTSRHTSKGVREDGRDEVCGVRQDIIFEETDEDIG